MRLPFTAITVHQGALLISAHVLRRYGLIKVELQEAELPTAGTYAASVAIGEQVRLCLLLCRSSICACTFRPQLNKGGVCHADLLQPSQRRQ